MQVKMKSLLVILLISVMYGECYRAVTSPVWKVQTLEECEAENKTMCFTGMYSEEEVRPQINQFVSSNAHVLKHFQTYRMTGPELTAIHRRISISRHWTSLSNQTSLHRPKRGNVFNISASHDNSSTSIHGPMEPHIDCSSVCCVTEDMTPPFSHIKENDGWEQVASTPEFPQRVSFYTEICTKNQAPCAGVEAVDEAHFARCVQFNRHHAIAVFNKTTGLTFRYIEVPVTCKCVLAPKDQDVAPVGPLAVLKLLQAVTMIPGH